MRASIKTNSQDSTSKILQDCVICNLEVTNSKSRQLISCIQCTRKVCPQCINPTNNQCDICQLSQEKYKNQIVRQQRSIDDQNLLLNEINGKKISIKDELEILKTSQLYIPSYNNDIQLIESITKKLEQIQQLNQENTKLKKELDCEFQKFNDFQHVHQNKELKMNEILTDIRNIQIQINEKNETLQIKQTYLDNLERQRRGRPINQIDSVYGQTETLTTQLSNSHYQAGDLSKTIVRTPANDQYKKSIADPGYCSKAKPCNIF